MTSNRTISQLPPATHHSQPDDPHVAAAAASGTCERREIHQAPATQVTTLTAARIEKIGANGGTSGSTVPAIDGGWPDNQATIRAVSPRDASASAAVEDPSIDCTLAAHGVVPRAIQTRAQACRGPRAPSSCDEAASFPVFFDLSRAMNLSLSAGSRTEYGHAASRTGARRMVCAGTKITTRRRQIRLGAGMRQANLLRGFACVIVFRAPELNGSLSAPEEPRCDRFCGRQRAVSVRLERTDPALSLGRKALIPSDLRPQRPSRCGKFLEVRLGDC